MASNHHCPPQHGSKVGYTSAGPAEQAAPNTRLRAEAIQWQPCCAVSCHAILCHEISCCVMLLDHVQVAVLGLPWEYTSADVRALLEAAAEADGAAPAEAGVEHVEVAYRDDGKSEVRMVETCWINACHHDRPGRGSLPCVCLYQHACWQPFNGASNSTLDGPCAICWRRRLKKCLFAEASVHQDLNLVCYQFRQ